MGTATSLDWVCHKFCQAACWCFPTGTVYKAGAGPLCLFFRERWSVFSSWLHQNIDRLRSCPGDLFLLRTWNRFRRWYWRRKGWFTRIRFWRRIFSVWWLCCSRLLQKLRQKQLSEREMWILQWRINKQTRLGIWKRPAVKRGQSLLLFPLSFWCNPLGNWNL